MHVHDLSALAAATFVAVLLPHTAWANYNALNCEHVQLKDAVGVPAAIQHAYKFSGICYYELHNTDEGRTFLIAELPVDAEVRWDSSTGKAEEALAVLGVHWVNGKSVAGKVSSEFTCKDDPVITYIQCAKKSHDNSTNLSEFSGPYSQGRPIMQAKTTLTKAMEASATHATGGTPPPPPPQPGTSFDHTKQIIQAAGKAMYTLSVRSPKNAEVVTRDPVPVEVSLPETIVHQENVYQVTLEWQRWADADKWAIPGWSKQKVVGTAAWTSKTEGAMVAKLKVPRSAFSGAGKWRVRAVAASAKVQPSQWIEFTLLAIAPQGGSTRR